RCRRATSRHQKSLCLGQQRWSRTALKCTPRRSDMKKSHVVTIGLGFALLSAALIAHRTQPPSGSRLGPRPVYAAAAAAASPIRGQVLGGGAPIANSTVTLWAASAGAPLQLGQTRTGADGRFALKAAGTPGKDAMLYLVAKGG